LDITKIRSVHLLLGLLWLLPAVPANAQGLPEEPVRAFDGRVTVGADVTATFGNGDEVAFFNYTDYEHNALKLMRLSLSADYRPASWLALVGELRSEDMEHPTPYAAYVRVRPWRAHAFDVLAGRIPPTFGAFARMNYGARNAVIGYPLAYQYLTSLRTDAVPGSADDLLRMRARGWRSSYPVGSAEPGPGIPLISAFEWDTGVQMTWKTGPIELSTAVTNGTLSSPRVSDDNAGKQVAARAVITPAVGLIIGGSAARGAWLSRTVEGTSAPAQRAFGADVEYSRDHWIARGELVWSRWGLPSALTPSGMRAVSAAAAWIEGRYRIAPRVFLSGRVDHLGFSQVHGTVLHPEGAAWDAPVKRVEGGIGYYLQRNLVLRASVQGNWRDGGRDRQRTYLAGQVAYWF
jgi:hypothetical protein